MNVLQVRGLDLLRVLLLPLEAPHLALAIRPQSQSRVLVEDPLLEQQ